MNSKIIYNYIAEKTLKNNNINLENNNTFFIKNEKLTFSIGICNKQKKLKRNRRNLKNCSIPNKYSKCEAENTESSLSNKNIIYDGNKIINKSFARFLIEDNNYPIISLKNYLNNNFLLEDTRKELYNLFFKLQKNYYLLNRFVRKIKIKYLKVFDIKFDLYMNPLENYNTKYKIKLVENNTVYEFKISDLLNIINDSITNCCVELFPEVKEIKNPFTNLPFSLSNLYNIYFKIKESNYIMPPLLTKLFCCNFDYTLYTINNHSEIRDEGILNFYKNASEEELYEKIRAMFKLCKLINKNFNIDEEYPRNEIIKIFKPFLKHFLFACNSINLNKVSNETRLLTKKLYVFVNYNKLFGRSILKSERYFDSSFSSTKIRFTKTFNKKYVDYKNIDIKNVEYSNYKIEKKINSMRRFEGYDMIPIIYTFDSNNNGVHVQTSHLYDLTDESDNESNNEGDNFEEVEDVHDDKDDESDEENDESNEENNELNEENNESTEENEDNDSDYDVDSNDLFEILANENNESVDSDDEFHC